ncbi:MAG: type I 3-dehydroquinate dehydratase [Candidatus Thorarchaeota archaeon]
MKFNICVPIKVKSADILELKSIISEVLRSNPNLIELRYDYIYDVQSITQEFATKLLANFHPKIPIIFTFRSQEEGGQRKIDEKIRFKILKTLIFSHPNYLDIEMNTEKRMLGELIDLAIKNDVNLIFSYHNFDKTPAYEVISDQINNFVSRLREDYELDSQFTQKIILKMIFTAQSFEDNLIPLQLCKESTKRNMNIISFCMGTLGIFSRILCVLNGSFLTYGSLVGETAPGQVDINTIKEILNILQDDK